MSATSAEVTTVTASTRCDSCGERPATHIRPDGPDKPFCEACARRDSQQDCGQAWTAVSLLASVIRAAEAAGMTPGEIGDAVCVAIDEPGEEHAPAASLPAWASGRFEDDKRWQRLED